MKGSSVNIIFIFVGERLTCKMYSRNWKKENGKNGLFHRVEECITTETLNEIELTSQT